LGTLGSYLRAPSKKDLDPSYTEFFAGSKLSIIYAANLVTEVLESELICTELFAGGFKLAQKLSSHLSRKLRWS